jgi:hypothetical protein
MLPCPSCPFTITVLAQTSHDDHYFRVSLLLNRVNKPGTEMGTWASPFSSSSRVDGTYIPWCDDLNEIARDLFDGWMDGSITRVRLVRRRRR